MTDKQRITNLEKELAELKAKLTEPATILATPEKPRVDGFWEPKVGIGEIGCQDTFAHIGYSRFWRQRAVSTLWDTDSIKEMIPPSSSPTARSSSQK